MQIIPVVHCFDNNYVIPAAVAFFSMLQHASQEYFYKLYVMHSNITSENQKKLDLVVANFNNASLEFINMENKFEDLFQTLKAKGHYSKEMLYKLLLASIFPQYEYVIVTDVDVIYQGDISTEFIKFLARDDYIACIKIIMRRGTFLESFYDKYKDKFNEDEREKLDSCGGYLIFNLKKIRENGIEELFQKVLETNLERFLQAEQDVINLVIPQNKRFYLPLNSLVCSYTYDIYEDGLYDQDIHYSGDEIKDALHNPIQLHYATAIKPWNQPYCTKGQLWFYYLSQTCFFYEWLDEYMEKVEKSNQICYTLCGIPIVKIKNNKAKLFGLFPFKKRKK